MKKIFIVSTFIVTLFLIWDFSDLFAQSYPPVVPPSVSGGEKNVSVSSESFNKSDKDDILKKIEVLEMNVNNFVPMLMKNSAEVGKIRDNADSLVVDLKKQLQDIKHSIKVYDLRLLDITSRLENLEKNNGVVGKRESINYVNNPLDVELKNLSDVTKKNDSVSESVVEPASKSPAQNTQSPEQKKLQDKTQISNQNLKIENISVGNDAQAMPYQDPLSRNQIHIPNLQ